MTSVGQATDTYRASLTGERLGWVIYKCSNSFSPVHRVLVDLEHGPVIIVGDDVLEVDPEDDVFATEEQAREAYFSSNSGQNQPNFT